jgi:hypothetical protein
VTHHLITLDPLALSPSHVGGHPRTRSAGDPATFNQGLPDGYAYVPDLPAPEFDSATQAIERQLTATEYGWTVRDLSEEELEARQPRPGPVTPRQFWLALYASDEITKEGVEILLTDNIPALIELRESIEIDPAHPLIAALAAHPTINKTPEEIAAIFLHAATL